MLLKRMVTFVLTLLILFADSGQTIYAHTCLKSKHTHISLGQPKHCCGEKKESNGCNITKAPCCEISSRYLKQDFISRQTIVAPTIVEVAVLSFSPFFIAYQCEKTTSNYSNTSPPGTFSKSKDTFTQTFRI